MESSVVKKTLKSICCSNGWSYALLWRFNQQNPMLLTLEDAYYEEQMSSFVDIMLLQFHILGQGIIGQAASTRNHSWIFSDFVQENSETSRQFSCGIKTVAVVPVEPKGVLQFGSTQKISESTEFVNRIQRLFQDMGNAADGYARSSLTNEADDLNELFASLISSGSSSNENVTLMNVSNNTKTHDMFNDLNDEAFLQSVVSSTSTWSNEFEKGIRGESSILPSLPEEYTPAVFPTNNLCQPMGVSSDSGWSDILMDFPIEHSHTSGKKDLFEALELDFRCGKYLDSWKDFLTPLACTNPSTNMSTNTSRCVSELPRKGLFSELGLEKFLQGGISSSCVTNCSFEDQPSFTKRRKTQTSASNAHFTTALSSSSGSMQPLCNLEKPDNLATAQQLGRLWIDDNYSIDAGKPKKPEEPVKVRKRARPGQSTRPRPKDRQMIQDRLKELKVLIPNGAKMSIDSLLDETVKYMLFLQSVTKYAEKLKEVDQPKGNVLALKDNSNIPSGGATWAFEVGGQTMGCPIVIKDLSQPGQKLIEMVCEDRGLFLEIADVIRGFGFNILKGEMEVQGDKLWAHFLVEESDKENIHTTRPTRVEILESLLKHTQSTSTRGIESRHQLPRDIRNDGIPQLNYNQQPRFPFPVSVGQTR